MLKRPTDPLACKRYSVVAIVLTRWCLQSAALNLKVNWELLSVSTVDCNHKLATDGFMKILTILVALFFDVGIVLAGLK